MKTLFRFTFGGASYALLEIVYRGFTHFSMFIAGGICFCILLRLAESDRLSFFSKCVIGGLSICAVEFAAGCIVNLWLGLGVWDYTLYGFHLWGQVCLRYLVIWCALSAAVMLAHRLIKARQHKRERID